MKYNKQIMTEIHKSNYVQTKDCLFGAPELIASISDDVYYSSGTITGADIEQDNLGFIYIKDENENKSILLDSKPIVLNKNVYKLETTVNASTNFIIIAGNTTYTMPENYKPINPSDTITLNGINSIMLKTADTIEHLDKSKSTITINPPIVLNSLPDGSRDYLVIDPYTKRSYIIVKVGELILTGNESWEMGLFGGLVISNPDNKDFRYVYTLPYDFGIHDPSMGQSILSSHFSATGANSIRMGSNLISTTRDTDNRGFMISIAAEYLKDGRGYIENFKNYLRACYKSNNPVRILYKLKENRVKPIQIDDYTLNTYFPSTILQTNYPSNVALSANTINL